MAKSKLELRLRRKKRIRKKLRGTASTPRLSIYKSLKYIYAQLVDDDKGHTLASASTLDKKTGGSNATAAKELGSLIAEKAKASGIEKAIFDRNGFLYHGVVKQVADSAREAGLKI